ncbi:MAG: AAA family ATPase [Bryobacterales bacterium]|nr:AAA family ATPase [Bryobacterales bacterium]MBV9397659.1 AAA family ATPase [Bryobacterales bacterium]
MYEKYFGLATNPFSMTPDPAMLFMTPTHREALAGLAYAILERKGFVALTGEAGTGKTSLLARTLTVLPKTRVASSVILNPSLNQDEFLEMMLLDFGFREVAASKARRLLAFQEFLLKTQAANQIAVLVVDEAHKLTPGLLEEIRLLSNLEFPGTKLLQIVLAGQPELIDVLNRPDLRQLNQRVSVRLSIGLLKPSEISQYIALRWSKSASTPPPFADAAYREIALWSRGIPRLVNSICDNALMLAFAETSPKVEPVHVGEAGRDLSLADPGGDPVKFKAYYPAPSPAAASAPGSGITSMTAANRAQLRTGAAGQNPKRPVSAGEDDDFEMRRPALPLRVTSVPRTLNEYSQQKPSLWQRWVGKRRAVERAAP